MLPLTDAASAAVWTLRHERPVSQNLVRTQLDLSHLLRDELIEDVLLLVRQFSDAVCRALQKADRLEPSKLNPKPSTTIGDRRSVIEGVMALRPVFGRAPNPEKSAGGWREG